MGSCVTKQKTLPQISSGHNQESAEDEPKNPGKSSGSVQRNSIKQKKIIQDSGTRNDEFLELTTNLHAEKKKTPNEIKLIKNSLKKHFIFNSLTEKQIDMIIDQMKLYTVKSNEIIFEQNSKGNAFFIVSSGRLEIAINGVRVSIIKEGDSFGELALIHDTPRTATVRSLLNSNLWVLDRRTFRSILEELSVVNYNENKSFIESVPVFKTLSESQKEALVTSLTSLKYFSGQKIVNEGDSGELFFIIKEGTVSCVQKGFEIRKMAKGDFFGEQALLYSTPRTATVIALEDVECVALNREELESSLGASLQQIVYQNSMRIAFDSNETMKKLTKWQADNLISEMEIKSYEPNDLIIHEKTLKKNEIYIIVKGSLRKSRSTQVEYKVFDVIGEVEVINNNEDIYTDSYLAIGHTDIAHISNSGFINAIGGDYNQVSHNNQMIKIFQKIQLFRWVTSSQLEAMVNKINTQVFLDGMTIVEENSLGESFFIIKSGNVDIIKDNVIKRTIGKYDYFGERSLLFNDIRSASVVAHRKVECWVLYKSDFLNILNAKTRKQLLERIELQDDSIELNDLIIVNTLGSGMFGNVFLTMHKTTKKLFALKTVDRRKITAYEIEENIILERSILLQLDHPFIVKLVRTFKDSKRLYFLMEFVKGMDLFDVLRKIDCLKECDARFYIACIFLILEHLHERSVIYRDLKPENIVIDVEGYPKLIDFGTAKILNGRTYTIVGTPHYMAPEVITSHGYGLSADYWTVGVMLYEFMFGIVPFGQDEDNPYSIYERVQERRLVFPKWVDNKNKVKEFINQLLSKNPASRLGGSFENLKAHSWFVGLNWDKVLSKQLKAPYMPEIPSFEEDIETALKNLKNLEDIISKIESKADIPKNKKKSAANWDEVF